jgi:hypothetical protein
VTGEGTPMRGGVAAATVADEGVLAACAGRCGYLTAGRALGLAWNGGENGNFAILKTGFRYFATLKMGFAILPL